MILKVVEGVDIVEMSKPFFGVERNPEVAGPQASTRILDFQLNCKRTGLAGIKARELDTSFNNKTHDILSLSLTKICFIDKTTWE